MGDEKGAGMEITSEHKSKMEDIIVGMATGSVKCRKDFQYYKSSLEELCPIKGVGAFDNIECTSKDALCCGFSFAAVGARYCKCPLRRYVAINFHR